MQTHFTKELIQSLKVIVLGLALGVGINYAFAVDWTAPTANPPANNVSLPIPNCATQTTPCIDTSATTQMKSTTGKSIAFLPSTLNFLGIPLDTGALILTNTTPGAKRALFLGNGTGGGGLFSSGNIDLLGNLNVGNGGASGAGNIYVSGDISDPATAVVDALGFSEGGPGGVSFADPVYVSGKLRASSSIKADADLYAGSLAHGQSGKRYEVCSDSTGKLTLCWQHKIGPLGFLPTTSQSCADILGIPGNQGKIQLRVNGSVAYVDKCWYHEDDGDHLHDATYVNSGNNHASPRIETISGTGYVDRNGTHYELWVGQ